MFQRELLQYLHQEQATQTDVLGLLRAKDREIEQLSRQITRYKCEQIKSNKVLKQLQDKVNQIAPCTNQTNSSFMMASQFKSYFQQFMTMTLPSALSAYCQLPHTFVAIFRHLCEQTTLHVNNTLECIMKQLCSIMKQEQREGLFYCVLKVMQQNWERIFLRKTIDNNLEGEEEEITLMLRQLHQISVYMVLQELKWEFVFIDTTVRFSKQEHCCVDGWVGEDHETIVLLQGLRKGTHNHATIKTYVIPQSEKEQHVEQVMLSIFGSENKSKQLQQQKIINKDHFNDNLPLKQKINNKGNKSKYQKENKQIDKQMSFYQGKENNFLKIQTEEPINQVENLLKKSPSYSIVNIVQQNSQQDDIFEFVPFQKKKVIKKSKSPVKDKSSFQQDSKKKKNCILNNAKIASVINEMEQQRKRQQLPLKRSKVNTSRKTSVGKIISQNISNYQHKDQKQNNFNKCNKQKLYRQIVQTRLKCMRR